MGENSKKGSALTIILVIVIVALMAYIAIFGNVLPTTNKIVSNKALKVIDTLSYKEYEDDETFILKVKNVSSENFTNVTPTIFYFDSNGMPIHEAWGSNIGYFEAGSTRSIIFYDTIKEYSRIEVGLLDNDYGSEKTIITDLRDKITYEVKESDEVDEDGEKEITFVGKNNSDKDIAVEIEISYYSGNEWIYQDNFNEIIYANSDWNSYEYLVSKYYDGKAFPQGFTYKVTLVEAVEYVADDESISDDTENIDEIDSPELTIEDEIESAVYKKFKEAYGDKMDSAKIYVDNVYTAEDGEEDETIKSLKLGDEEYAFEISAYIYPAEGADITEMTIPDGEYNEENGYIEEVHRLGILKPDSSENGKYKITNFGTGW